MQSRQAEDVNRKICRRFAKYVFRRTHETKHRPHQRHAYADKHRAGNQRRKHRGVYRVVQVFMIARAVILRDNDRRADGKPAHHAHDHIDDAARRADGGQRFLADEIAHDDGVDSVIQLLKQIAQQKRQRKADQMAENTALRHNCVPCV